MALKRSHAILEEKVRDYKTEIANLLKERQTHVTINFAVMDELNTIKKELEKLTEEKGELKEKFMTCEKDLIGKLTEKDDEIRRLMGIINSHSKRVSQEHDYRK